MFSGRRRPLKVCVYLAPPFVYRRLDDEGALDGLTIRLWETLARELDLEYTYTEVSTFGEFIRGVTGGDKAAFDLGLTAATVTAARWEVMDFSAPYYTTGLGAMVHRNRTQSILRAIRYVLFGNWRFWALLGASSVGLSVVQYGIDRAAPRPAFKSYTDSLLWATQTLVGGGGSEHVFASAAQRLFGLAAVLLGVTVVASYIGIITSELARAERSAGIRVAADLQRYRVGIMDGGTTAETFLKRYVPLLPPDRILRFPGTQDPMRALLDGVIDVYINDTALLQFGLHTHSGDPQQMDNLYVLPEVEFLSQQAFSIVMPRDRNKTLLDRINRTINRVIESDQWRSWLVEFNLDRRGVD